MEHEVLDVAYEVVPSYENALLKKVHSSLCGMEVVAYAWILLVYQDGQSDVCALRE